MLPGDAEARAGNVPQNVIEAEIFETLQGHSRHARVQAERPGRARHQLLDPVDERGRPERRGGPAGSRAARRSAAGRRGLGRRPAAPRNPDHAARGTRRRGWASPRRTSPTVVRVATIGDIDAALAKVSIDDRLIPVRVQLDRCLARGSGADRGAEDHDGERSGRAAEFGGRRRASPRGRASVDRLNRERARDHRGQPARGRGAWHRRPRGSTRSWRASSCRRRCGCRNRAMPRCSRN